MVGQWIGEYQGSVSGSIMVNVDKVGNHYECVAYLNPVDVRLPSTIAYLQTEDDGIEHIAKANLVPVNPKNDFHASWEDIKHFFPEVISFSKEADVSLRFEGHNLLINAKSENDVTVFAELTKLPEEADSRIDGKKLSWSEFKQYVSEISKSKYLFRGQQCAWRLRTSFHRRGRYRLSEFITKDVRQLHKRLSAITRHYFDLSIPDQNGSFFNLLQHHGYPTPLLDWSHSPYVAAFFAFRDLPQNFQGGGFARIYIFDNESWQNIRQVQAIDPPYPHVSVMEFIALGNSRLVPQQAVTTVTNVDDIESYLLKKSLLFNIEYLTAIDIQANERDKVMADLRFMGITAGSMFPGVDGVCEEIRELNFNK